jgi:hypothetical protein
MQSICKLCDNKNELLKSHIIPNFVYKWLKKTSGTDFLRYGEDPNRRVQDGFKPYYFCEKCEEKFSKWERAFNNHIFAPLNNDKIGPYKYLDWLLKFAVSISWRNLIFAIDQGELPKELDNKAHIALDMWKRFLNNESPNPCKHQQHMIVLNEVTGGAGNIPTNINRYILRTVARGIYSINSKTYVYTKMGKILLIGFIEYHKPRRYWNGSQIHAKKGILESNMSVLPPEEIGFFLSRAEKLQLIESSTSPKERDKIDEIYKKKKKKALDSETVKATQLDIELFGKDRVFKRK